MPNNLPVWFNNVNDYFCTDCIFVAPCRSENYKLITTFPKLLSNSVQVTIIADGNHSNININLFKEWIIKWCFANHVREFYLITGNTQINFKFRNQNSAVIKIFSQQLGYVAYEEHPSYEILQYTSNFTLVLESANIEKTFNAFLTIFSN